MASTKPMDIQKTHMVELVFLKILLASYFQTSNQRRSYFAVARQIRVKRERIRDTEIAKWSW
jgi:hypothetical protein